MASPLLCFRPHLVSSRGDRTVTGGSNSRLATLWKLRSSTSALSRKTPSSSSAIFSPEKLGLLFAGGQSDGFSRLACSGCRARGECAAAGPARRARYLPRSPPRQRYDLGRDPRVARDRRGEPRLESVIGGRLLIRFGEPRRYFDPPLDVWRFHLLAGLVSTAVAATIGTTTLSLAVIWAPTHTGPLWLTGGSAMRSVCSSRRRRSCCGFMTPGLDGRGSSSSKPSCSS
jgi:hypothetical protein